MNNRFSRRAWIASGAAMPFALDVPVAAAPTPPPYTLSINIEIMFPRAMPRPERMKIVAGQGFTAYSFWNTTEEEQEAMLKVQQETGLKCASITGPGNSVSTTGLTKPGMEKVFLDDMTARVKMASKFGGPMPIIFVGRTQPDVPWEQQRSQIVERSRRKPATLRRNGASRSWSSRSALRMAKSGWRSIRPRQLFRLFKK